MSLADDLNQLEQLRERGSLSADEFARAKVKLLGAGPVAEPAIQALNGFRRSSSDRWLGGLCGGLARSTGMQSWLWRLLFALLFFAGGIGLICYVLLWIFVPLEDPPYALPAP